jgi:hypothetical protein
MAVPTLNDLLNPQTKTQVQQRLLATLQGNGFPVTDWAVGGVARTIVEMESDALTDYSANLIPQIAGGGYLDYATGNEAGSPGDWLALLTAQMYGLARNPATFAIGYVTLTNASTNAYSIGPNGLWVTGPMGNRYNSTNAGTLTIPASGTLIVTVQSESPNNSLASPPLNYIDGANTLTTLITPFPGVTVNNPAPDWSSVTAVANGTGAITLSRTSGGVAPTASTAVQILITAGGAVGVSTFSYQVTSGGVAGALTPVGTTVSTFAVPGTGTTIAMTGVFALNDTFTWNQPGSWLTQQGTDEETNASLIARAKARWPSLSAVPTADVYSLWSKAASSQVTRTLVAPDAIVPGQVDVLIAGQAGQLPAGVIATVQSYLTQRAPLTDRPVVTSPINQAITIGFTTASVNAANYAAAQTAATAAVANYVNSTGLSVTGAQSKVYLSAIIEALMLPAGMINVSGVTINGTAADYVVPVNNVATFTQDLSALSGWVPV